MSTADQPLSGIRVVDFSSLIPGPLATLMLQEAGADVIRITRPDGDPMAKLPPYVGGVNAEHIVLTAGKDCFAADLRNASDLEQVRKIIATADVLVEGFRPGVMGKYGLGYEDLKTTHPKLIYCSITGYGQNGPNRSKAGHDINYQAESGLLAMSPGTVETPSVPPALVADIAGGSFASVINILLALLKREKTGQGSHLDIAMADGATTLLIQAQARRQATGADPCPRGEMLTGGSPRYDLYATKDGRFLAVGAIEEKFWEAFCATVGLPLTATSDQVRAIVLQETSETWEKRFEGVDACVSLVSTLSEAMESNHAKHRSLYTRKVEGPDGIQLDALPLPISQVFRHPSGRIPEYSTASLYSEETIS
ncbi:CaiB/BaiF CoA transferase family protein [Ruegeria sp.]|uniref:CaiB/BaiF CoA transferase family protein n=1 Tax=Ruegeria sp. TaxID=1879320 RepID=UPI003C7C6E80